MVKAIKVYELGGPEVLKWEDVEIGEPKEGELRVKNKAIGLNFIDVYFRKGVNKVPTPYTPGMEAVGVVTAIGPGLTGIKVGDVVAYAGRPMGSYSEEQILPASVAVAVPPSIDPIVAASIMLKGMTAQYLLRRCFKVEPGHKILVHAAAGGTGSLLCQWANALGAMVIGTVSTEEKAAQAKEDGCHHVIIYKNEDFVEAVKKIAPEGLHVVYDSVGKDTFQGSLACLKTRGYMVCFGNASGVPDPIPLSDLAPKSLFLTRPSLFQYNETRAELVESAGEVFANVASGVLRVRVNHKYPLAQAAQAHADLENRKTTGSVVLIPDDAELPAKQQGSVVGALAIQAATMVKAIKVYELGGPEVLKWEDVEIEEPKEGEVRVKNKAIGLNFIDVYFRKGVYRVPTPFTPGMEAVGVVTAIGPGLTSIKVGDVVAYAGIPMGSYSEEQILPASVAVPVPPSIDPIVAASIMLKGMTAQFLLRQCFKVEPGHKILVHAAAGGVGSLLCQWANALGAMVIGTVSTEEKAVQAKEDGCHHVIIYKNEDFAEAVQKIAPEGVHVVYDSVGKDTFQGSLACLKTRGYMVSFGNASGVPNPVPLSDLAPKSLFLTRSSLFQYIETRAELLETAEEVFANVASGVLRVRVNHKYPLAQAAQAHADLESRKTTGSVVLIPDDADV
ncbi:hypothetical protein NE237_013213 [Protea cynaroides]|uniref:Probable quinone oxidoreductase n=1 Tax=Protea cynaroides TaxID=273540 RepID=A0A9Q0GZH8_9MAGN|nr:hypothetical protein NE237_013213 [Protea cynaroides]